MSVLNMPVSSPMGMRLAPEVIIFSIKVDPHLGNPTMKMGLMWLLVSLDFSRLTISSILGNISNQYLSSASNFLSFD